VDLRRPRALLQRLADAANPGAPEYQEPAPEPAAEPEPVPAAVPPQPVRGGARLPDWRKPPGPLPRPDEEGCKHPNPRTFKVGSTTVPYWCPDCRTELHLDVPADEPKTTKAEPKPADVDPDDEGQEDEEQDQAEGAEEGDEAGEWARPRRRWDPRGSGRKQYLRPAYSTRPAPRQSLIQWWMGISGPSRWLLYNGTALAGGFTVHVPQFFTHEVAFLVAHHHSWTDLYVCFWYGVAALVLFIDRKTRAWVWPFALAGRVPLISMIIGALLYGTPSLPA
jgi:hypothetical protein